MPPRSTFCNHSIIVQTLGRFAEVAVAAAARFDELVARAEGLAQSWTERLADARFRPPANTHQLGFCGKVSSRFLKSGWRAGGRVRAGGLDQLQPRLRGAPREAPLARRAAPQGRYRRPARPIRQRHSRAGLAAMDAGPARRRGLRPRRLHRDLLPAVPRPRGAGQGQGRRFRGRADHPGDLRRPQPDGEVRAGDARPGAGGVHPRAAPRPHPLRGDVGGGLPGSVRVPPRPGRRPTARPRRPAADRAPDRRAPHLRAASARRSHPPPPRRRSPLRPRGRAGRARRGVGGPSGPRRHPRRLGRDREDGAGRQVGGRPRGAGLRRGGLLRLVVLQPGGARRGGRLGRPVRRRGAALLRRRGDGGQRHRAVGQGGAARAARRRAADAPGARRAGAAPAPAGAAGR